MEHLFVQFVYSLLVSYNSHSTDLSLRRSRQRIVGKINCVNLLIGMQLTNVLVNVVRLLHSGLAKRALELRRHSALVVHVSFKMLVVLVALEASWTNVLLMMAGVGKSTSSHCWLLMRWISCNGQYHFGEVLVLVSN